MTGTQNSAGTDADRIAALFTGADGAFRFARWGRPLAPVVHGTDDAGIRIFEQALQSTAALAGLPITGRDPEMVANFLVFFVNDWDELSAIPALEGMIPGVSGLISRLQAAGANQYRVFGFDQGQENPGAIRACIILLRYDTELQQVPAQTLAVTQSLLGLLTWAERAFRAESPVALDESGHCAVKPWHAALLRAAYDPAIPAAFSDPALALRLAARLPATETPA